MNKYIPLIHQQGALRSYFPDSVIRRSGESEIKWEATITPSPLSGQYRVKLVYKESDGAKIFVTEPKPLKLAPGKTKLPHVYSTPLQQLCLYYPEYREWHPGMFYVHTLIPWASEWLLHYEFWLGTGEWHGGGIEHENGDDHGKEI